MLIVLFLVSVYHGRAGLSIYQLIVVAFQQSYICFHNSVHQNSSEDLAENLQLNQFCDQKNAIALQDSR